MRSPLIQESTSGTAGKNNVDKQAWQAKMAS